MYMPTNQRFFWVGLACCLMLIQEFYLSGASPSFLKEISHTKSQYVSKLNVKSARNRLVRAATMPDIVIESTAAPNSSTTAKTEVGLSTASTLTETKPLTSSPLNSTLNCSLNMFCECTEHAQCSSVTPHSVCETGSCVCDSGYYSSALNNECLYKMSTASYKPAAIQPKDTSETYVDKLLDAFIYITLCIMVVVLVIAIVVCAIVVNKVNEERRIREEYDEAIRSISIPIQQQFTDQLKVLENIDERERKSLAETEQKIAETEKRIDEIENLMKKMSKPATGAAKEV